MHRRSFSIAATGAMLTGAFGASTEVDKRFMSVPAEDFPHARTWMCWASTPRIYGGGAYFESVQENLGRLAAAIAEREPVIMLGANAHHERIRALCGPRVAIWDVPTDDMWARDSMPVFTRSKAGAKGVIDFQFNGWGNKQQHKLDSKLAQVVAAKTSYRYIHSKLVGEGGGLEYDGDGTLILAESCWVNDNRNPGLSRNDIEATLKSALGVRKVIWVPGVRGKDITDGHIDGSVRIVRPGLLMMGGYPGDTSIWGQAHEEAKAILGKALDARGRRFEIVEVPSAVESRSNHPDLFTGYANYYVANGAVYTPSFGDKSADRFAQDQLQMLFPEREIVALEIDRIYECGGGIHCVTQQEPI